MTGASLSLYGLFALAEIAVLLALVTAVAVFKWRAAHREAAALRQALSEAKRRIRTEVVEHDPDPGTQRGYADFLREQLEHSSLLLGEAAERVTVDPDPETAPPTRQMLAMRHQFLQLELDHQTQTADADPETRRQTLVAALQALLDGLHAVPVSGETDAGPPPEQPVDAGDSPPRFDRLRTVIDDQQAVMRELRRLLEAHGDESEGLAEALQKLNDAETQVEELQRCLLAMQRELGRRSPADAIRATAREPASPDAEMLRDLVGGQQRTITKLQTMLQTLVPESGRAQELADAIEKIRRSNNELNSCVMVLEDENNMLRDQVETLQGRIADLEAGAVADGGTSETDSLLSDLFGANERPLGGT